MDRSTTVTVRLPAETKAYLDILAEKVGRTSSFLAAEAITAYVASEMEVLEGIEVGCEDIKAGRYTSHAEVMRDVRAEIEAAGRNREVRD